MKKTSITLFTAAFTFLFSFKNFAQAGNLDSTFGVNGVSLFLKSHSCAIHDIALQPDGKIIAVGDLEATTPIVIRLKTNGTIDSSFGSNGLANTGIISSTGYATGNVVKVQADGKIVVAINDDGISEADFFIVRYNSNGTPDSSFGSNAVVKGPALSMNRIDHLLIQADGKILAAGSDYGSVAALIRYTKNGSLDQSFGNGGIVIPDSTQYHYTHFVSVDINSKNKIIALGTIRLINASENLYLTSFDINGKPDSSFGNNGIVVTGDQTSNEEAIKLQILSNDKMLVAFSSYIPQPFQSAYFILKYNANGTIDKSFGRGGKIRPGENQQFSIYDLLLQPDGKIVAGGRYYTGFNYDIALWRFLADGSSDNSFGNSGVSHMVLGRAPFLNALALQNDGKIIAGGSTFYPGRPIEQLYLARYLGSNEALAAAGNQQNLITKNNAINVFPNPAKDMINITGLSSTTTTKINITDNSGRIVMQTAAEKISTTTINISTLVTGIYYVRILAGNKTTITKFVKQ